MLLEIDVGNVSSTPISQFLIEVDNTEEDVATTQGDFLLHAKVVTPRTTSEYFVLGAKVRPQVSGGGVFELASRVEGGDRSLFLAAKVKRTPLGLTDSYTPFRGPYEVRLLDHNGTLIQVIEKYTRMEFSRTINGMVHHGYGEFTLTGAADLLPVNEFTLDRIVQVRRLPPFTIPVVVYEGLCRIFTPYHDETGHAMFVVGGVDLKHLAKRRIIIPPANTAFLDISAPITDIMKRLVLNTAGPAAGSEREMSRLRVLSLTGYGVPLNLHYRHTVLSAELDALAEVEDGADWSIDQNAMYLDFQVFYPFKGKDRRRLSAQLWPEMVWSLDRASVVNPRYTEDRSSEITVTYVGGEGIGEDRVVVARENIADRQYDSPWNRIEEFIDSSSETSLATLYAQGDANNVEKGAKRVFTTAAAPKEILSYGDKWNLGDICTGEYTYGGVFDLRIVEVRETLDPEAGHVMIEPMFYVYPRLQDY